MTPLRFHPEADAEMMEAAVFYENQQQDLGKRFLSTVQNSLILIQINPDLYPSIHNDVKRCITKSFPFYGFILARLRFDPDARWFDPDARSDARSNRPKLRSRLDS